MFKKLTDWTISLAQRKSAQYWLAFIAFLESSVFVIPADVLYIPMAMVKKEKAYHYALIATVFSVLGGIAGWFIGHFAYEAIAKPVLMFYGKYETFEWFRSNTSIEIIILLLVTSGLSHLPPMKIVTILSGVVGVNIWIFIILAIITRGGRFYLLAWLIIKYGNYVLDFILRRLKWIVIFVSCILIIGFVSYKMLT